MKLFCAHCLKPFETPISGAEFCSDEHKEAYKLEVIGHREKEKLRNRQMKTRDGLTSLPTGGHRAVNHKLSDGSELEGRA